MMNTFLSRHWNDVTETCRRHHVRRLFAFGSVCSDQFNDESDVDLLVDFNDLPVLEYGDAYFALLESLKKIFGRDVDLVTESSLSNPYFIESIEESKMLIYGTGEKEIYRRHLKIPF